MFPSFYVNEGLPGPSGFFPPGLREGHAVVKNLKVAGATIRTIQFLQGLPGEGDWLWIPTKKCEKIQLKHQDLGLIRP